MPWKKMTVNAIAKSLEVNVEEVHEKQKLIEQIVKARMAKQLSQASLAKKLGTRQSRIAQIESGIGTSEITLDILLNILVKLGFHFKITIKHVA